MSGANPTYPEGSPSRATIASLIGTIAIIAASYVFFLIFAQFAFVKILQNAGFDTLTTRIAMGCMGGAGALASVFSGRRFRHRPAELRSGLLIGFLGCALSAGLALFASAPSLLCVLSAGVGVSLGILTVYLAGGLSQLLTGVHRGLWVGCGTGLGYFICNVPSIFAGTPRHQTLVAIVTCLVGAAAVGLVKTIPAANETRHPKALDWSFIQMGATFLALVWLDSAAFYIIQATPALNRFGWGSFALEWQNAGIHLATALLGGVLLDRGGVRGVLCVAYVCLASAAVCLSGLLGSMWLTHWFYATGVSLYSTALVFAPALARNAMRGTGRPPAEAPAQGEASTPEAPPQGAAAFRAGLLYAVAGWLGSALGIGMAQDLHQIPSWFVLLAGITVLVCAQPPAWWNGWMRRRKVSIITALLVLGWCSWSSRLLPKKTFSNAPVTVQTGREVYIAEGCIHCHSQFVRKGTRDELWWGPWMEPGEILKTQPPLIGNRRQGPDLLNVGNRRSMEWNRLHLMDPRSLSPDSRMPAYATLFGAGDSRGPALLLYLASLGMDTFPERTQSIVSWQPAPNAPVKGEVDSRHLYLRLCAQCHGAEGRGDGPLSTQIAVGSRPRNLAQGDWIFYARGSANPTEDLARTIKFGVPGTSMPGHERLEDSEVLGLASYVQSLKAR